MKRFTVIVILLGAALLLAACAPGLRVSTGAGPAITGSRNLVEKSYDLSGFTAVDASAGATVEITRADTPGVKITVDDNAVDYVKVEKKGDTLVIGLKDGSFNNVTLKAAVAMPELLGVTASGGSRVTFDEFSTTKPVAFMSTGGADIKGAIQGGPAQVTASGGANLTLTGRGERLTLDHSGGGSVKLGAFPVGDANVTVSGGSQSEINASGIVNGTVTGGGTLKLVGQASSVDVKESGGGQVIR